MDDMKDAFGDGVKVVSGIRSFDMAEKKEILPPLESSIAELLWRDIAFAFKGSDIVVCTSKAAFDAARGERKVMLEDVIRYKRPDFDFSKTLLEWEGV